MTTPHFCMQCGAALNPGDRFCEACGSATTPAYPAAPPPRPQAAPPSRSNGNWILGLGIVVLTGLGIFFLKDPAQLLKFLRQPEGSTPQTQPVTENPTASPTAQAAVTLDDFVGAWIPAEGDPGEDTDTLVLYREGDKVVADIEGDRLELSNLNGRTLSGYVWSPYEDVPTPVTAELNENKQRVIFTASPPNSEPMVAVAQRVQPGASNPPTAPITTPPTQGTTGTGSGAANYTAFVFDPPSNVRTYPNGPILCAVRSPQTINLYGNEGDWFYTDVCGDMGMIHTSQIRLQPGPSNPPTAPIATSPSPAITEAIAIEQVINLPDVAEWQELVRTAAPQNSTHIEVVEQTPTNYLVHVYEIVNNPGEPSHTATFGWYEVDRQTGMVFEVVP
ncbi:zinc ribbon domain-containing protein [Picosynechococcus sp. PCC 7003]|uniref:zinc ribbon domain-containing protein n=1 Tax=Picosynechococcus sp. PCC 7003 TaxID=374981 RepID=UPI000A9531A9|nr:zinc ribbon domain-containing protein [Picosynechococcus sp. PCC 7003]